MNIYVYIYMYIQRVVGIGMNVYIYTNIYIYIYINVNIFKHIYRSGSIGGALTAATGTGLGQMYMHYILMYMRRVMYVHYIFRLFKSL
jgi:hypothetical protein